jgi:hypothetical protein
MRSKVFGRRTGLRVAELALGQATAKGTDRADSRLQEGRRGHTPQLMRTL